MVPRSAVCAGRYCSTGPILMNAIYSGLVVAHYQFSALALPMLVAAVGVALHAQVVIRHWRITLASLAGNVLVALLQACYALPGGGLRLLPFAAIGIALTIWRTQARIPALAAWAMAWASIFPADVLGCWLFEVMHNGVAVVGFGGWLDTLLLGPLTTAFFIHHFSKECQKNRAA